MTKRSNEEDGARVLRVGERVVVQSGRAEKRETRERAFVENGEEQKFADATRKEEAGKN